MDPAAAEAIKTLLLAGVFLMQLQILYRDGRADRAAMLALLTDLTKRLDAMQATLDRVERLLDRSGPNPPTPN